jgi:hypothetical protein
LGWGSQVATTTRTISCFQGQLGIVVDVVSVGEGAGRGRETKMCTRVKCTAPYTEKPLPEVFRDGVVSYGFGEPVEV